MEKSRHPGKSGTTQKNILGWRTKEGLQKENSGQKKTKPNQPDDNRDDMNECEDMWEAAVGGCKARLCLDLRPLSDTRGPCAGCTKNSMKY